MPAASHSVVIADASGRIVGYGLSGFPKRAVARGWLARPFRRSTARLDRCLRAPRQRPHGLSARTLDGFAL